MTHNDVGRSKAVRAPIEAAGSAVEEFLAEHARAYRELIEVRAAR